MRTMIRKKFWAFLGKLDGFFQDIHINIANHFIDSYSMKIFKKNQTIIRMDRTLIYQKLKKLLKVKILMISMMRRKRIRHS